MRKWNHKIEIMHSYGQENGDKTKYRKIFGFDRFCLAVALFGVCVCFSSRRFLYFLLPIFYEILRSFRGTLKYWPMCNVCAIPKHQ